MGHMVESVNLGTTWSLSCLAPEEPREPVTARLEGGQDERRLVIQGVHNMNWPTVFRGRSRSRSRSRRGLRHRTECRGRRGHLTAKWSPCIFLHSP